ncbi:TPA: hypothetical protein U2M34_003001 [Providencia rettgeri]|nr:hypothetical protein [Providencia rettgeri]HEM8140067.1 hypothetical protein [Providencia rettgeri]
MIKPSFNNYFVSFALFLFTAKIASPFGIFIITFLLPNIIIIFLCLNKRLSPKILIPPLIIISIILISFISIIILNKLDINYYADYYYITIPINILFISLIFGTQQKLLSQPNFWDTLTKLLISINFFFLIAQVTLYYIADYSLDLGALTGGNEIRGITNYNDTVILRPGGIYEEPSIYAAYVFSFLVLRFILVSKKFDIYIFIGVLGLFLTMSTISIFLASLFLIFAYLKIKLSNLLFILTVISISIYFSWDYLSIRLINSIDGVDPSNATKFNVINQFINDPELFWFGFGIVKKHLLYGLDGLGDTTIYTSLITIFGFIWGFILVAFLIISIFYSNLSKRGKILALLVFIKLSWPAYSFFWVMYLFFVFNSKYLNRENRE